MGGALATLCMRCAGRVVTRLRVRGRVGHGHGLGLGLGLGVESGTGSIQVGEGEPWGWAVMISKDFGVIVCNIKPIHLMHIRQPKP